MTCSSLSLRGVTPSAWPSPSGRGNSGGRGNRRGRLGNQVWVEGFQLGVDLVREELHAAARLLRVEHPGLVHHQQVADTALVPLLALLQHRFRAARDYDSF